MSLRRSLFQVRGVAVAVALLALAPTRSALGADPRSAFERPLAAFDAAAVERAKAGAARWLEKPECLKVLTDFTDGEGRTLDLTLATWGMSAVEYVLTLPSGMGPAIPRCRHARIELVTHVGLRPIYAAPWAPVRSTPASRRPRSKLPLSRRPW